MADAPRWVRYPATGVPLDIDTITAIAQVRRDDALRYATECEKERDHARAVLDAKQKVHEYAAEQARYWERILTEVKTFDERPEDSSG